MTALTVGVSRMAGSLVVEEASRMMIPSDTKIAGMTMENTHIFLSRLKVSNRFHSRAIMCAPNRDLERSMLRPSLPLVFSTCTLSCMIEVKEISTTDNR